MTLAQTELQLAQSAPELHNLYEAYRRMYKAIGVRDVDTILKPADQGEPEPKDPAQENAEALDMIQLTAFQGQNHNAHIMSHLVFGSTGMVMQMPQVATSLQKHVMEHVALRAKEQVAAQMAQMQEAPSMEQALEMESMVAELIAQGLQEVKAMSMQISGQGQPDPLVALKEQDLQLRAQRDANENAVDQARLQLDEQKATTNAALGEARIRSTEDIAQARIDAAKEREIMKQRNQ